MAGDWIKFELATPDKPEVWAIAAALSIDPDAVVGKLLRVWGWFDQQTENGNAPSVSKMLLDRLVGVTGFCKAVIDADWMQDDGVTLSLPHFDRHNGKTAKNRATTAKRVASFKNKTGKGNAEVTPAPLPKEEKRREENILNNNTSSQATGDTLDKPDPVEPVKPAKAKPDYPEWFEAIWSHYPTRAGGDNKRMAFQKAGARIKEGKSHQDLFNAVDRYKYFVVATGKASTEYVKQAATFFGSMDNINNPWTPPALGVSNHAQQPKSAIERFMQNHQSGNQFENFAGGRPAGSRDDESGQDNLRLVGGDDSPVR
jgi:chorismate mutase